MQVGSYEVLLSDTLEVAEKLKRAGVRRRLSVYEGMFHVFQMGVKLTCSLKCVVILSISGGGGVGVFFFFFK